MLGNILKENRLKLKLTQKDLAKAVGVSERFVIYLEQDKRFPSFEILEKICKVLKINKLPMR